MSYILEALRKSERERQRNQAQLQDLVLSEPALLGAGRRSWLAWTIGVVVALNVATLAYLWARDRHAAPPTNPAETRAVAPARAPQVQAVAPPAATATVKPQPQPAVPKAPVAAAAPAPTASSLPKPPPANVMGRLTPPPAVAATRRDGAGAQPVEPKPAPANAKVPKSAAAPQSAQAEPAENEANASSAAVELPSSDGSAQEAGGLETSAPAAAEPVPVEAEKPAPLLRSMPADFQAKIPALKISAHVYFSDPRRRFAVINMTRYEAGAQVADGLRLEAIDAEGLVLNYEGTRFRVNRP